MNVGVVVDALGGMEGIGVVEEFMAEDIFLKYMLHEFYSRMWNHS